MLVLLAHTLIGLLFVIAGILNIKYWRPLMETMTTRGVPHPWLILTIGIAWEAIAGLFIIFGIFVKLAALSLILFTIIAVFIGHAFWRYHGEARLTHLAFFITHCTITLGALILLLNNIAPSTQMMDLFH